MEDSNTKKLARLPKDNSLTSRPKKRGKKVLVKDTNGRVKEILFVELFAQEYLSNGGHATAAYLKYNPNASLTSASASGSYFLNKAKKLGLYQAIVEKKGYNFPKMIDVALEKMDKSNKPDWWDRIMKLSGYEDFTPGGNQTAVTVNTNVFEAHRDFKTDYVVGEVVEDVESEENPAQDED